MPALSSATKEPPSIEPVACRDHSRPARQSDSRAPLWTALCQLVDIGAQTLAGILVARALGAQAFGEFAFAFALVGILSVVLLFGAGDVAITMYARGGVDPSAVLYATARLLLRGSLLASAVAAATICLSDLSPAATAAVGLALATLIGNGLAGMFNLAIVAHGASRRDLVSVSLTRLALLLGLYAMSVQHELASIMAVYPLSAFALAALRGWQVHSTLFPVRVEHDEHVQRELGGRARKVGVGSIMGAMTARADTLLLRLYAGAEATGLYAASYRFVNAADAVATALATALFPRLNRQLAAKRAVTAFRSYLGAGALLSVLVACSVPFSFWLASFVYGSAFASAAAVLAPLLLAAAVQTCGTFIHKWWIANAREHLLPRAQLVAAVVGCGAYLFTIPRYGALGAALSTLASQLTLVGFHAAVWMTDAWLKRSSRAEPTALALRTPPALEQQSRAI